MEPSNIIKNLNEMLHNTTPGPWAFARRLDETTGKPTHGYEIYEAYEDDPPIAETYWNPGPGDARLIAAAPDLVNEIIRLNEGIKELQEITAKMEKTAETTAIKEIIANITTNNDIARIFNTPKENPAPEDSTNTSTITPEEVNEILESLNNYPPSRTNPNRNTTQENTESQAINNPWNNHR